MPDQYGNPTVDDLMAQLGLEPDYSPLGVGTLPPGARLRMEPGQPVHVAQSRLMQLAGLPTDQGVAPGGGYDIAGPAIPIAESRHPGLERVGMAFADNPIPYQVRRGQGGLGAFLESLAASTANSYGTTTARRRMERDTFNERSRAAGAERNKRNLMASEAARALVTHRWEKKLDSDFAIREHAANRATDVAMPLPSTAAPPKTLDQIKAEARARAEGKAAGTPADATEGIHYSDSAKKALALQWAVSGQKPSTGMGKAARNDAVEIANLWDTYNKNLNLPANKSRYDALRTSEKTLTDANNKVEAFSNTALANSKVLLATMRGKFPDFKAPIWNKPLREIARQIGNENMAMFKAAKETVAPEFARILQSGSVGNQQLSDTAREEIRAVLDDSYSLRQMAGAIGVLALDTKNRRQSYANQIQSVHDQILQMAEGVGAPP